MDIKKKTCTCREWDLTGIPCQHAICAIYASQSEPEKFVDEWYLEDRYLKAYNNMLKPMKGKYLWKETGLEPIHPPPHRKMPGRPKTARRKDPDESKKFGKLSRKGRVMTCRLCKSTRHNIRGCPVRKDKVKVNVVLFFINFSFNLTWFSGFKIILPNQ